MSPKKELTEFESNEMFRLLNSIEETVRIFLPLSARLESSDARLEAYGSLLTMVNSAHQLNRWLVKK